MKPKPNKLTPGERFAARALIKYPGFTLRKYINPADREMWRLLDSDLNARLALSIQLVDRLITKHFLSVDRKSIIAKVTKTGRIYLPKLPTNEQ